MTKKPPCNDCCLRTIEIAGEKTATVSFTITMARNPEGGTKCGSSIYSVIPNISEQETNVSVNLVGDNECGVPDLSDMARENFKEYRDRWESDPDFMGEDDIKDQVNEWLADNCDFFLETGEDGKFANQSFTKDFSEKITSRTREAEFCGSEFRGFPGDEPPRPYPPL